MTDNTNNLTPTKSRRLVIVTGDKGGVGKSTFSRAMIQTYLDNNQNFAAFDADMSNPQIKRFYEAECTVMPLDIFRRGEADISLLDELKGFIYLAEEDENKSLKKDLIESPDYNVIDSLQKDEPLRPDAKSLFLLELPPQSIQFFRSFEEEMGFFKMVGKKLDMRVTMATVINRTKDSVNQFIHLRDFCGDKVDYVVVKNLFFGEKDRFERYDNCPLVKELKNLNKSIPEIYMPDLIAHAYDYLDENNLSFSKGIEQSKKLSVQGRVEKWMENFKKSIEPAKHLLGLADVNLQSES
ncbi:chromosome partitioning protein ParA [Nostoc sp. FACHB-280]|uniref:nucleotide-binding protein n=1 Tax=Nostoc sp. FACHB-280 TaxID=2692839 RepID=UPI00168B563E|nr:chromosome partitioning protein ParA [Nostoc sp. FACHB-280]MBD2498339.1 chromosome partitioning protein ParA [Nostoc sp. FACHB-280]